ncbi:MAG: hypothetical protein H7343_05840 [Undibacterium sp.]|nr:hypothetical protein [Opitutaceae bacterium]
MAPRRRLHAWIAAAALLLGTGCQPQALDEKVTVRDDLSFSMWLSRQSRDLTLTDRRDLTDALQQIKFTVMTASPGLTPAEQTQAAYAQLQGHTIREILSASYTLQHDRIAEEVAALLGREDRYRTVDPAKLNADAREFLEGFKGRMEQRRSEMQRLEDRRLLIETR